MRTIAGKQNNNIRLQTKLTVDTHDFNKIVPSQKRVLASYETKKTSLTGH